MEQPPKRDTRPSSAPSSSVDEKYIGETEKNLADQLDTTPQLVAKPWWKRLLRL